MTGRAAATPATITATAPRATTSPETTHHEEMPPCT